MKPVAYSSVLHEWNQMLPLLISAMISAGFLTLYDCREQDSSWNAFQCVGNVLWAAVPSSDMMHLYVIWVVKSMM